MTGLLEAHAIDTYYGRVQILKRLSLSIDEQKITTIIGPNGAGKSTALKALFGLVPVKRGQVTLDGDDVTNKPPRDMVHRGVCFVPQGRAIFPSLTVEENLAMGAYIERDKQVIRERRERVLERFPRLGERRKQVSGSLSGGEQQMLAMGRALMVDPQVLLLDEPSVGLAPQMVKDVLQAIRDIHDDGKTIVIVEQNATMALKNCHNAYLLVQGEMRMHGKGEELLGDPKVQEIYLGGG